MNPLILLEHRFIEMLALGNICQPEDSYRDFQKKLVGVYSNEHSAHDIHAALMLVEHELEDIIEKCTCSDILSLARKTLGLVNKFEENAAELVRQVSAPSTGSGKVDTENETDVVEGESTKTDYKWNGHFTELVELIDSLLELEKIVPTDPALKEFNASAFIRDIFSLLNIRKTPQDFRAARNKLYEKNVDLEKGETRCKLLTVLLANTEEAWEKKYLTKGQ